MDVYSMQKGKEPDHGRNPVIRQRYLPATHLPMPLFTVLNIIGLFSAGGC